MWSSCSCVCGLVVCSSDRLGPSVVLGVCVCVVMTSADIWTDGSCTINTDEHTPSYLHMCSACWNSDHSRMSFLCSTKLHDGIPDLQYWLSSFLLWHVIRTCQLTTPGYYFTLTACEYLKVAAVCLDVAPSGDRLWYHLPVPALLLQKADKGRFARRWTHKGCSNVKFSHIEEDMQRHIMQLLSMMGNVGR